MYRYGFTHTTTQIPGELIIMYFVPTRSTQTIKHAMYTFIMGHITVTAVPALSRAALVDPA